MIIMTRRLTFVAAHAEPASIADCSGFTANGAEIDAESVSGHNYVLDVGVSGKIDPHTGIVVNIKEIDRIVKERIIQVFDQKLINRRVQEFQHQPVTPENLVGVIRARLLNVLPPSVTLDHLRLEVTPTQIVEWQGNDVRPHKESGAILLTRGYEFAASHRLHSPQLSAEENRQLFGKCNYEHGHGHNYELEVTVAGPVDPRSGRVLDPDALDVIVNREVVDRYDHRHFNYDIPEFAGLVPSAEVITRMIWDRLEPHIPAPARLYRVLLRETPRNIFEYYGEV